MSKSHRLFDLMQALRRHRMPVSGLMLAQEMGVSLRTIRRDISTLQAIGADIEGEPGVGYVLKPGFLLPPLMFSEDELQALTLGVEWVRAQTDNKLAQAAEDLLARIAAVLPAELRNQIYDVGFYVNPRQQPPDSIDLTVFRQAIREQRKLSVSYQNANGEASVRIIWPLSLGFVESQRYVVGWCELRQSFRVFRLDRIENADIQPDRYTGRRRDLIKQWQEQLAGES